MDNRVRHNPVDCSDHGGWFHGSMSITVVDRRLVRGVSRNIGLLSGQFATQELDGIYYHGGKRWISFDASVCLDRRVEAHFSSTPWQSPAP